MTLFSTWHHRKWSNYNSLHANQSNVGRCSYKRFTRSKSQKPSWQARHILDLRGHVGCIYASNPQVKSNILRFHFISFNSIVKSSRQPKNIFSIFSIFLLTFILVLFVFYALSTVWRFMYLLPPWGLILSRGSTYRHIGFIQQFGCPIVKVLKGWVGRYMRVRHTHIYPLSSVSTLTEEVSIVAFV